jgi:hypothetical protein
MHSFNKQETGTSATTTVVAIFCWLLPRDVIKPTREKEK